MDGVIIGFGTIAMGHAHGYAQVPEISIKAVVDPCPERRQHAERAFGFRAYATFDEMMARETPDFVDICAPPHTHADYLEISAAHRLHALCEKPILLPPPDGYERFLERVVGGDRVVYPCHNYKFAPVLEFMQGVVRSPDFGSVLSARFRTLRSGHAVGVPEWNPDWRRDPAYSGGGILRDHGPHSIYLATHLTGHLPVSVSCLTGNMSSDRHSATEDTALLTIRCADGTQIVLDLSWCSSFRNSYYSVIGSAGTIVVENDDVYHTRRGEVVRSHLVSEFDDPSHRSWFRRMFVDFLAMVAEPERQYDLIREAVMTSVVIDTAYRSAAQRGAWLDVNIPAVRPVVRN